MTDANSQSSLNEMKAVKAGSGLDSRVPNLLCTLNGHHTLHHFKVAHQLHIDAGKDQ